MAEWISQEKMTQVLDDLYNKAMNGIAIKGISGGSCEDMAARYLRKHASTRAAADDLIGWQIAKCTTSGFVTSLGGFITLPVAIPANVASVLYVQIRMIGALAIMGGYDLRDDEVQTLVYLCLVQSSITDICKAAGIQVAEKVTVNLLKKIPGEVLKKINQKVGFRLVTKFGEKGAVNLVKLVPFAGGFVGGAFDLLGTKRIADKAKKVFIEGRID